MPPPHNLTYFLRSYKIRLSRSEIQQPGDTCFGFQKLQISHDLLHSLVPTTPWIFSLQNWGISANWLAPVLDDHTLLESLLKYFCLPPRFSRSYSGKYFCRWLWDLVIKSIPEKKVPELFVLLPLLPLKSFLNQGTMFILLPCALSTYTQTSNELLHCQPKYQRLAMDYHIKIHSKGTKLVTVFTIEYDFDSSVWTEDVL